MKKTLIFALTLLMMVSCGKQTFEIRGNIDPEFNANGLRVTLLMSDEDTVSTLVEDNAFSLKHDVDENADIAILLIDDGRFAYETLIPEEGIINLDITKDSTTNRPFCHIGGTENNDLLSSFTYNAMQTMMELDENEDKYTEDEAMAIYSEMLMEFMRDNINNKAGIAVFAQQHYYLNTDQLGEIFALMDERTLAKEDIQKVHERYLTKVATSEGKPFTDFSAPTPEGTELAVSDLVGKTDFLLIDFWASWCGPCRQSMPEVKALYERANGKLEILGVSLDNDEQNWKKAIESLGLPWKHISDLKGWQCEGARIYGVNAIPATVLIDKEGIIVGRNLSAAKIAELLSLK